MRLNRSSRLTSRGFLLTFKSKSRDEERYVATEATVVVLGRLRKDCSRCGCEL